VINFAAITKAIKVQLEEHPGLADFKGIDRGDYINTDESRTPWVGIYRDDVDIDPRTLGKGANNWTVHPTIRIWVQAHGENGEEAEDELCDALQRVLTALIADLTFGGTVEMIKSFRVQFTYMEKESETLNFQWAIITLVCEVRSS
jgi:hypothetical protein